MIYILHGGNDLTKEEKLLEIRRNSFAESVGDLNITTLPGRDLRIEDITSACNTVPFLAEKRLVIVTDILSKFEGQKRNTRQSEGKNRDWTNNLHEHLVTIPDYTDLVFMEGNLSRTNPVLKSLRPIVEIHEFQLPNQRSLPEWISDRAKKLDISIDPNAIFALAQSVGPKPLLIDSELHKLSMYRNGQPIKLRDVNDMVSYVREVNIFAVVDLVIENKPGEALKAIHKFLDDGNAPAYLITMIARQLRLLLMAKELKYKNKSTQEIGREVSLSGYPLKKLLAQETSFTNDGLIKMHDILLKTDYDIKTGKTSDNLALDMLILEMVNTLDKHQRSR